MNMQLLYESLSALTNVKIKQCDRQIIVTSQLNRQQQNQGKNTELTSFILECTLISS